MTLPPTMAQAVDGTLAGSTLSSPLWIQAVTDGFQIYVLAGGAVLLTLRIVKAIIDWKKP